MPEAPTILVLSESLQQFVGKKLISVDGSLDENIKDTLLGKTISAIQTYGKKLLVTFDDVTISVHLMMFGSYTINSDKSGKLTIGMRFKDGNMNFYASTVKLLDKPLMEAFDWQSEIMNSKFDGHLALIKLKQKPDIVIVDGLINQDTFAGIGNKIRNEVLFRVHVHPLSRVKNIPDKKLKEIIRDCVKFSLEMLEWKREGVMDDNLVIYKRKVCPRDEMPVRHDKLGSRTIHYCEKCQFLYE